MGIFDAAVTAGQERAGVRRKRTQSRQPVLQNRRVKVRTAMDGIAREVASALNSAEAGGRTQMRRTSAWILEVPIEGTPVPVAFYADGGWTFVNREDAKPIDDHTALSDDLLYSLEVADVQAYLVEQLTPVIEEHIAEHG